MVIRVANQKEARARNRRDVKTVEEIKAAIEAAVPGAVVQIVTNPGPSAQHSLLLDAGMRCRDCDVSSR